MSTAPLPSSQPADFCFTLLNTDESTEPASVNDLRNQLETGSEETRLNTMRRILTLMLSGEPMPQLLMTVIRFVMPSKNKQLKKMLLLYWELVPKRNADGKLKQEMILVCNAIRNDLIHPNEFIRGSTLRFLCKLREPEILEPLVPVIRSSLEHRHAFVRRNAIFTIYTIFKNFEFLIPDAADLIAEYITKEQDLSCKRNAFIMLFNSDQNRAIEYLNSVLGQVGSFGDVLQLVIIELIRKVCRTTNVEKAKYLKCIFSLLSNSSNSVKYEAATSFVALTSAPSAVKAAASAYVELALKEPDNSVKLIVLDRLSELKTKHGSVLDDLVMDVLRILSSPDLEVRRRCLKIGMDMISPRNVNDAVAMLIKELSKTQEEETDKIAEYRQLLIQAIHNCAILHSEVAGSVVYVLMDFLGDSSNASATDVITFVREVVEKFSHLRASIMEKLIENLSSVRNAKVLRGALWIVGEYSADVEGIEAAYDKILASVGELPILVSELRLIEDAKKEEKEGEEKSGSARSSISAGYTQPSVRVLADGTYATESALSHASRSVAIKIPGKEQKPAIRHLLLSGDFFLGAALATALTKLALRYGEVSNDANRTNYFTATSLLVLASIIRIGKSDLVQVQMDDDSFDRIQTCIRILSQPDDVSKAAFIEDSRKAYSRLLQLQQAKSLEAKQKDKKLTVQPDELINFRQLKPRRNLIDEGDDEFEADITRATGQNERSDDLTSKLDRVFQLTGFSDAVYAEAYIKVHQYDIVLDVMVVNQTNETLQNLSIEFATLGDLKLVERPSTYVLGPHGVIFIKTNIKVSSTESGIIFGNIVFDGPGHLETTTVVLNDIHIDVMDYINPSTCDELQFRSMWQEFEWENKVNVNTNITDLRQYLNHIMKCTNMGCLTPESALAGDCGFLGANLYARSIFGEDALANVCLEKQDERITGHIRIRTTTQGIAISLGEKINTSQSLAANVGK